MKAFFIAIAALLALWRLMCIQDLLEEILKKLNKKEEEL